MTEKNMVSGRETNKRGTTKMEMAKREKTQRVMKCRIMAIMAFVVILALCACGKKDEIANIHTELQQKYLADQSRNFSSYAKGVEALDRPEPARLSFKGNKSPEYTVYISEHEDMSEAVKYSCSGESLDVYNLKIGTIYYYYAENGDYKSEVKSITVDGTAPRNLYIDGVINFRDLGGWKTVDGNTVKQGFLYRSAKFSADETGEVLITDAGREELERLGIKTEIDLRRTDNNESGGISESVIGSNVKYVSIPLESGGNIILLNKDKLKEIFAILGNKDNYPIVFHCSIGTDRTGMVTFLVNGLMGVAEDDLYRDFLFSNFAAIGDMRTPSIIDTYKDTVDLAGGKTLSEKIENYLLSVGVEKSDIDAVKGILSN